MNEEAGQTPDPPAPSPNAGLLRQLQTQDPSSPGNSLLTMLKDWAGWRMKQDMSPEDIGLTGPGGAGASLVGMLRDALGKPRKFYHGTGKSFKDFDPAKVNPDNLYGPGYYHTDAPPIASGYAEGARITPGEIDYYQRKIQEIGTMIAKTKMQITANPALAKGLQAELAELMRASQGVRKEFDQVMSQGPNIRPAYLDIKRPFDIDSRAMPDVRESVLDHAPPRTADQRSELRRYMDSTPFTNGDVYGRLGEVMDKPEIRSLLEALGFDGITHIGGGRTAAGRAHGPHNVGIAFDPKQIISPWKVPE